MFAAEVCRSLYYYLDVHDSHKALGQRAKKSKHEEVRAWLME